MEACGECICRMSTPSCGRAHTDPDGRFSITGIPPGPLHFGALPYNIDNLLPSDFEKMLGSGIDMHGSRLVFTFEKVLTFCKDFSILSLWKLKT